MRMNVKEISAGRYTFDIDGVSYVGRPLDHTVMYAAKKIEGTLCNLAGKTGCLVFVEENVIVPEELQEENCFVFTPTPQRDYAEFISQWAEEIEKRESRKKYTLQENGFYLGENVTLGEDVLIEPGCVIGHDVVIGDHARIHAGAKILHSVIGHGFIAGENCTVGSDGFTLTEDSEKNKIRIPTLGMVVIGDQVEIGPHANVSRGSAGNTEIRDHVKIDALVHIGHDSLLHENVKIPAGAVIGGFVEMMEGSCVGISAVVRNRITIGKNAIIGMGAVVTKSVPPDITMVGNPAKPFEKK